MTTQKIELSYEDIELNKGWKFFLILLPFYCALLLVLLYPSSQSSHIATTLFTIILIGTANIIFFVIYLIATINLLRSGKIRKFWRDLFLSSIGLVTLIIIESAIPNSNSIFPILLPGVIVAPYVFYTIFFYFKIKQYWKMQNLQSNWLGLYKNS